VELINFVKIINGSIVVAVVLAVFALESFMDANTCKSRWKDSKFESRFDFLSGCQIKLNNRWIDDNTYDDLPTTVNKGRGQI